MINRHAPNVEVNIFKDFLHLLEGDYHEFGFVIIILSLLRVIQVWISLMQSSRFLSTGTASLTLKPTYIWVLSA